jgi:regulatory protein
VAFPSVIIGHMNRFQRDRERAERMSAKTEQEQFTAGNQIAIDAVTRRMRSEKHIVELLVKRGVVEHVAEAVVERLKELKLIDDEAFAGAWVRTRVRVRGVARKELIMELVRQGVSYEVAECAVEENVEEDDSDRVRVLAQRLASRTRGLDRVAAERRIVGMLGRRGYPIGLAVEAAREALSEANES